MTYLEAANFKNPDWSIFIECPFRVLNLKNFKCPEKMQCEDCWNQIYEEENK